MPKIRSVKLLVVLSIFIVTLFINPTKTLAAASPFFSWSNFFNFNFSIPRVNKQYLALKTNSPQPTGQPLVSPKITAKPQPSDVAVTKPSSSIKPASVNASATSIEDIMIQKINSYRSQNGLASVQKDPYTCSFAKIRAQEIASGFNHDGFSNRLTTQTLPYPSYSLVTENIAMTANYQDVVNMWINSSNHAANMRAETPYVCVQKYGNYFAYEGWKP